MVIKINTNDIIKVGEGHGDVYVFMFGCVVLLLFSIREVEDVNLDCDTNVSFSEN